MDGNIPRVILCSIIHTQLHFRDETIRVAGYTEDTQKLNKCKQTMVSSIRLIRAREIQSRSISEWILVATKSVSSPD